MHQEVHSSAGAAMPALPPAPKRGAGTGSRFFVLERSVWEKLWLVATENRLNLLTAFLVLLAGTGADQLLSKWSAHACEFYAGMGKPRAKKAIDELIAAGLIARCEGMPMSRPQYRFAPVERSDDPIFLPNQLITGAGGETPILRRVRQTGDEMLLRMLIDFYGMVQTDATHGLPLASLHTRPPEDTDARRLSWQSANTVWLLPAELSPFPDGPWCDLHDQLNDDGRKSWELGWDRLELLEKTGALWYEAWVFDGEGKTGEPLFPLPPRKDAPPRVAELQDLIEEAAALLLDDRMAKFAAQEGGRLVVLPSHHRAPGLLGVARLRMEPDTPGRRAAFARRDAQLTRAIEAYRQLRDDLKAGHRDRPVRL